MTQDALREQILWIGTAILTIAVARFGAHFLCRMLPGLASRRLGRWRRTAAWRAVSGGSASFAGRAPRAGAFLRARFDRGSFLGWRLTVTCLLTALAAISFIVVAKGVLDDKELRSLDDAILASLSGLRAEPLLTLFAWITGLGSNAAFTAAVATAAALLWAGRKRQLLAGFGVAVLGSQVSLWAGKFAFGRARPEFLTDVTASSPSFPSGHSAGAMAIYGFIAYAVARTAPSAVARVEIVFWAALVILLMGFSRIYLHVHYPSDVIGGFLIGGFWLVLGSTVTEWRYFAAQKPAEARAGEDGSGGS